MDIKKMKELAKNKIECDSVAKQVRKRIKETAWEKQNQREGFRESFKPLIDKLEKPEDDKTRNIYTQIQEMLKSQLALTAGIRENQKAITDSLGNYERLAYMRHLPDYEAWERDRVPERRHDDKQPQIDDEQPRRNVRQLILERNFDGNDLKIY